jgi:outer membrane protein assembly factor BamB
MIVHRADAIVLFLACLVVLSSRPARAEDWPQWGGADHRNMASPATGIPDCFVPGDKKSDGSGVDPKTTKNVKWVAKLGSQTCGNPVVAGGRVYIGTNDFGIADARFQTTRGGVLKCLDEQTGSLLWQLVVPRFETKLPNFNYDCFDLGVCSSPAVEGDRVYLVTNRGEVLCLDARGMTNGNDGPFRDEGRFGVASGKPPATVGPKDADIVWRLDMVKQIPVWPQDASNGSVLLHGDLLYVSTSNGVDASHDRLIYPLAPSLIALDKRTGRIVARDDEKIGTRTYHGQWSSPSLAKVGGRTLLFYGGGDGVCYAFEALSKVPGALTSLKKVWSFDCNPPNYKVRNGKPIAYRSGDVRLHRGNANDGTLIGPSEIIATPVCHDNRVYIATGQDPMHGRGRGMLCCIDATKTGDITQSGLVWRYDRIDRSLSTVSVVDGLVYAGDENGSLHCLDAATGKPYWVHHGKAEAWGSSFVVDGKVFFGTKKSFWILEAGREKKVLAEIQLGSPVYMTPIPLGRGAVPVGVFVVGANPVRPLTPSCRSGIPASHPLGANVAAATGICHSAGAA